MDTITYRAYSGEHELPHIISFRMSYQSHILSMRLAPPLLPHMSHLPFTTCAQNVPHPVGVIVCKQSPRRERYL
ncbi:hypothetical protein BC827DRAFT_1253147, partial [Russula dissimulans]